MVQFLDDHSCGTGQADVENSFSGSPGDCGFIFQVVHIAAGVEALKQSSASLLRPLQKAGWAGNFWDDIYRSLYRIPGLLSQTLLECHLTTWILIIPWVQQHSEFYNFWSQGFGIKVPSWKNWWLPNGLEVKHWRITRTNVENLNREREKEREAIYIKTLYLCAYAGRCHTYVSWESDALRRFPWAVAFSWPPSNSK